MPGSASPSARRGSPWRRRIVGFTSAFAFSGAFYLLLIDTTDLPELYVGCSAAVLAALAFEVARKEGIAGGSVSPRWLLRLWAVVGRVPADLLRLSWTALLQVASPRSSRGVLRAIPFGPGGGTPARETGRRALAEALGSLAPNTIVIGVDTDRNLILAHQLRRSGRAATIDPAELG
jgi:hypothetical protein